MATNDKYDRQLRLWGANGQRALSNSRILLIGTSAAGTETLKNLVLPGVGEFVILDEASNLSPVVESSSSSLYSYDMSNFFIPLSIANDSSSGDCMEVERQCCAKVASDLLQELNPDVKGRFDAVSTSLKDVDYEEYTKGYTLVIAADMGLSILKLISKACLLNSVNLISVKSYGLIGTCRIQTIPEGHVVVESKPSSSVPDLRISNPFPELLALCDAYHMDALDFKDHSHVPFVIILFKAISSWRVDHEGKLPKSFSDKEKFKTEYIKAKARDFENEMNFQEALNDAYLAYSPKELPFEVKELLDNVNLDIVSSSKRSFDIMILALKEFIAKNNGDPPLNGTIPDMTSGTDPYVALQQVYHKKADDDFSQMRKNVNEILSSINQTSASIPDDELKIFCKNVFNIQVLHTRSIADELSFAGNDFEQIKDGLIMSTFEPFEIPAHTPLLWFVALRASEIFEEQHGVYPGKDGRELSMSSDIDEVMKISDQILQSLGLIETELISSFSKDHVTEIVRYFNAELHNIASIVGGRSWIDIV